VKIVGATTHIWIRLQVVGSGIPTGRAGERLGLPARIGGASDRAIDRAIDRAD